MSYSAADNLQDSFQRAMNFSGSPGAVSTSPTQSFMNTLPRRVSITKQPKALKPFLLVT